jgi:hypothetical protein
MMCVCVCVYAMDQIQGHMHAMQVPCHGAI